MSYAAVSPRAYAYGNPNSMTHPGGLGWKRSMMPNWGENPLMAGRPFYGLGMTREEGMAYAAMQAGKAAQDASISASANVLAAQAVQKEEAATATSPAEITKTAEDVAKVSVWPYVAIGIAAVAGIGMIFYARSR